MGTTIMPPQSVLDEQRATAIRAANRVRQARALLLRQMAALPVAESLCMCADLVEDTPEVLASLEVVRLLERVRRIGPSRGDGRSTVERLLNAAGVREPTRLGLLTRRQRCALAAGLRARADGSGRS